MQVIADVDRGASFGRPNPATIPTLAKLAEALVAHDASWVKIGPRHLSLSMPRAPPQEFPERVPYVTLQQLGAGVEEVVRERIRDCERDERARSALVDVVRLFTLERVSGADDESYAYVFVELRGSARVLLKGNRSAAAPKQLALRVQNGKLCVTEGDTSECSEVLGMESMADARVVYGVHDALFAAAPPMYP
jgi:hypothetical protein